MWLKFNRSKVKACNWQRLHHFMILKSGIVYILHTYTIHWYSSYTQHMQMVATSFCDQIKSTKLRINLRSHSFYDLLSCRRHVLYSFDNLLVRWNAWNWGKMPAFNVQFKIQTHEFRTMYLFFICHFHFFSFPLLLTKKEKKSECSAHI